MGGGAAGPRSGCDQVEEELVAGEGPRARRDDHLGEAKVSAVGGEAGDHEDGLALQERPDEDREVAIR